ncbi:MAG: RNA polymerase sigma-70 factor [Bacteroidia bacterium]|nr:RNA polymerase sigma-70 factor [Bacteroidia bacterium]
MDKPKLSGVKAEPTLAENQDEEKRHLESLKEGDRHAFFKIFESYHQPIYLYTLKFVKSPDLAADIVQDVFIKLWEIRESLNPDYSFGSFLFTIARNHIINTLKKASRESRLKEEILHHIRTDHNQNESQIIFSDLKSIAYQAIDQLPPQRKRVYKMFIEEGKDHAEIARLLGISPHTVRDHLTKAFRAIRQYLNTHSGLSALWLLFDLFR